MLRVEDITLVLLAAGRSQRFGDIGSKLDEDFLGKPLGAHVAVMLQGMNFGQRLAIVNGSRIDYVEYGFEPIHNDAPNQGMARSVRLGVRRARDAGAAAVLIALADMPRVTATQIHRILDAVEGPDSVVTSTDGRVPKPPALFGAGRFDYLLSLKGDEGARELVRSGRHVVTAPAELIDVDTPEQLEKLRALVHSPDAITRPGTRRPD